MLIAVGYKLDLFTRPPRRVKKNLKVKSVEVLDVSDSSSDNEALARKLATGSSELEPEQNSIPIDGQRNATKRKARSSSEGVSTTPTKQPVSKKARSLRSATALENSKDETNTAEPEPAKSTRGKRVRKPSQKALAAQEISSDPESLPERIGNTRSNDDDEGWHDVFTQRVQSPDADNCTDAKVEDNRSPVKKNAKTDRVVTPSAKHSRAPDSSDSDQDDQLVSAPTTPKPRPKSTLMLAKKPIISDVAALGTLSPQVGTPSDKKSAKQKTVTGRPASSDNSSNDCSDDNHSRHSNEMREKTGSRTKNKSGNVKETGKNADDSAEETTSKDANVIPGEETEETLALMPLAQRDPRLADDYVFLPLLRPAVMFSFATSSEQFFMAQYSPVWESLGNKIYQRLLKSAIKFGVSYPFINPSRAPLSIIRSDSGKFLITDPESDFDGQTPVLLTTGIVTECALVSTVPTWGGATQGTLGPPIKRIKIRPFTIEYERAVAYIGNALNLKGATYAGPIYVNGLAFTTRKAGFGQSPSTPSSSNRFLAVSPTRSRIDNHDAGRRGGILNSYPQCLNCHDDVPIYDARKERQWAFRPDELRQIGKLPRFKKGSVDLSSDRFIATVGYTVGAYRYNGSHDRLADLSAVSLNVMFAVVLGEVNDA